jgi:hypothetical protein
VPPGGPMPGSGPVPGGAVGNGHPALMRGRAAVIPRAPVGGPDPSAVASDEDRPEQRRPRPPLRDQARLLRRGSGWTWSGLLVAFLCWSIWAAANRGQNLTLPLFSFLIVLIVAAGLFALQRLIGRLVIVRWLGRERHTAKLSHIGTAVFLVAVGIGYLRETPWVAHLFSWVSGA